jgi:hypothetical protein
VTPPSTEHRRLVRQFGAHPFYLRQKARPETGDASGGDADTPLSIVFLLFRKRFSFFARKKKVLGPGGFEPPSAGHSYFWSPLFWRGSFSLASSARRRRLTRLSSQPHKAAQRSNIVEYLEPTRMPSYPIAPYGSGSYIGNGTFKACIARPLRGPFSSSLLDG